MAKKKNSESVLPTDITPSLGSNYGLDGFDFYDEMNEGVLEGARLPEVRGLSTLPGALMEDDSPPVWGPSMSRVAEEATFKEGPDLNQFIQPEGYERLPDLSWLELSEQDPARLPKETHNTAIPELVEAWGVHRRTDGIRLLSNNKDLSFEKEAKETSEKKRGKDSLLGIIKRAGRESASGLPWATVANNVKEQMKEASKEDIQFVRPYLEQIQAEHGLAGHVFIRHDFYPGYDQGKWKGYLRKTASDALYLVKRKDAPQSINDQEGYCSLVKKKIVSKIPWKKAYEIYQKKFASVGVEIPNTGNPKEDLRKAFHIRETPSRTSFHIQPRTPLDSLKESKRAIRSASRPVVEKISHEEREQIKERRKLGAALGDLLASGALRKKEVDSILNSGKAPTECLRIAIDLARKPKVSNYKGQPLVAVPPSGERKAEKQANAVRELIAQMVSDGFVDTREIESLREAGLTENQIFKEATSIASRRSLKTATLQRAQRYVNSLVEKGLLEGDNASKLISQAKDPGSLLKKASLEVLNHAREYSGATFTEVPLERGRLVGVQNLERSTSFAKKAELDKAKVSVHTLVKKGYLSKIEGQKILSSSKTASSIMKKVSNALGVKSREYSEPIYEMALFMKEDDIEVPIENNKVLDFLHREMNKGLYGASLSEALRNKFSKSELKKERALIEAARDKHEGLAGYIYIDALTYDEGKGTEGCTKGAGIHRNDGVPYVLGMKKCRGCVFKNPEGICQKYNKTIVEEPPVDSRSIQKRRLNQDPATSEKAISNMLEQEFVGNPVQEFELKNNNLNNITFHSEREGSVQVGFSTNLQDLELLWSK